MKNTEDRESSKVNKSIVNIEVRQDEITIIESFSPLLLLISIYFFPIHIFYLIGLFLYGLFFIIELYLKRVTPICILLFLIFFLLSILYFIFNQRWFLFYTGSFFYFPLALMGIVLLIIKRPFSIYYSGGKGMLSLHYTISVMWVVIYIVSATASIVLIPNPAFVYVPLLLMITGILVTIFLNYIYLGYSHIRKKEFNVNKYCVKEIRDNKSIDEFYSLFSKEVWKAISISPKRSVKSIAEYKEKIINLDSKYNNHIVRFMLYDNGRPIGAACCIMDSRVGLPIEHKGLRLEGIRKIGKILEIGDFTIDTGYRFKPEIFLGILKAIIDFALKEDIAFLVASSYEHSTALYEKIGLTKILDKPVSGTISGLNSYLYVYNLARAILYHKDISNSSTHQQLMTMLNPFFLERYYKRQLISNIIKKNKRKTYNLEEAHLALLLKSGACFAGERRQ